MKKELSISAIKEGSVIDHIPGNVTLKVVDILDLRGIRGIISIATNLPSKTMGKKGIIKISGKDLTKEEVDKIALIAPHATVNIIKNYDVKQKIKVAIPPVINKIIKCSLLLAPLMIVGFFSLSINVETEAIPTPPPTTQAFFLIEKLLP